MKIRWAIWKEILARRRWAHSSTGSPCDWPSSWEARRQPGRPTRWRLAVRCFGLVGLAHVRFGVALLGRRLVGRLLGRRLRDVAPDAHLASAVHELMVRRFLQPA